MCPIGERELRPAQTALDFNAIGTELEFKKASVLRTASHSFKLGLCNSFKRSLSALVRLVDHHCWYVAERRQVIAALGVNHTYNTVPLQVALSYAIDASRQRLHQSQPCASKPSHGSS